jgi:hypothetical protein
MAAADPVVVQQAVTGSSLYPKYAEAVDRESAYEMLAARAQQAPASAPASAPVSAPASAGDRPVPKPRQAKQSETLVEQVLGSAAVKGLAQSIGKEITRSIFGTGKRR